MLSLPTYRVLRRRVTIVFTARVGIVHWTAISKAQVLVIRIRVILASPILIDP